MSGNVYEWCSDWFGHYDDIRASTINPEGPDSGVSKVIRGGYRSNGVTDLHLTHRESISPDESYNFVGFRLVKNTLTAVNQVIEKPNVLFPNPANQFVRIQSENEIKNLKIINSEGKMIYNDTIEDKTFSVSNIPNGIYLVLLMNNSNKTIKQKLVVER